VRELLILGAGPSGLATAIAARAAGLDYEVLEKGVLVNSVFHFPRAMTFFTTPELLEIGGLPFVTPYEKPTQWEALRYYRRVADTYELKIALGVEVRSVRRASAGFDVAMSVQGRDEIRTARHVVIATGYYDHPNRLGVPGEDLPHVSHYYDDPHPFFRKRVVVVGGKNSSNTRELAVKCAQVLPDTIHVADAEELAADYADWLAGKATIGITGGTSTPEADLEEVRDRIYELTAA